MQLQTATYSQREIARNTGIPRSTIQSRIKSALAHGIDVPGITSNGYTDLFVDWITGENTSASKIDKPLITGVTPAEHFGDADAIWQFVKSQQQKAEKRIDERYSQRIDMPCMPFAIAQLSDIHLGNEYTDYISLENDCEIIANTPGMYVGFLGDATDNWIGKLGDIQRKQPIKHSAEYVLCKSIIDKLYNKWLYFILGNHGYRTINLAGVDIVQSMFGNCKMLYDAEEVMFTLSCGATQWEIKARHDWRKRNKNNISFGMEDDLRYGYDWDIALGGHIHSGTLLREHICRGRKRICISVGTYKMFDKYAVTNNFTPTPRKGQGSGALVFAPNGAVNFFNDLGTASQFLAYLRKNNK